MPKELIYSDSKAMIRDEHGNETPAEDAAPGTGGHVWRRGIHVGWTRGQYVEIGAAEFDVATQTPLAGTFLTLDRAGVNRLIDKLRTARNQAFGKDQ